MTINSPSHVTAYIKAINCTASYKTLKGFRCIVSQGKDPTNTSLLVDMDFERLAYNTMVRKVNSLTMNQTNFVLVGRKQCDYELKYSSTETARFRALTDATGVPACKILNGMASNLFLTFALSVLPDKIMKNVHACPYRVST